MRVEGFAALPTLTRANALGQYLFVNGRPVRDKLLIGAVRGAYADYLPRDRHPVLALFVDADPAREVDVNVHPAKAEVRFRNAGLVRALIVIALKSALARDGTRAATTGGSATHRGVASAARDFGGRGWTAPPRGRSSFAEATQAAFDVGAPDGRCHAVRRRGSRRGREAAFAAPTGEALDHPLGAARAQVHETYIVAQTRDGLVIVDQHAAHERIVYERLKAAIAKSGVARQILLIPDVIELDEADVERLLAHAEELAQYGLVIESFGPGAVALRETPSLLGEIDGGGLLRDLAEHIGEWDETLPLERRLMHVAATMACHGSVRAGRRLKAAGNERPVARDGSHAELRSMQSRPSDLRGIKAYRYRAAVRADGKFMTTAGRRTRWRRKRAVRAL